jgi:2-octaprenyl-6-methoxyphenol hydroxylase
MIQDWEHLKESTHYDALVVGAGMVGAPLSLGLAQLGFRTLLLEQQAVSKSIVHSSPSFDDRSTAMALGAVDILSALGLWDGDAMHARAISQVHVSEQGRLGQTRINASDMGVSALGYVVPNKSFGEHLNQFVVDSDVELCGSATITSVSPIASGYRVCFSGPDEQSCSVTCSLLLALDGVNSATARMLGVDYQRKEYGQHAIIANVETELPNKGHAFERFSKMGPLAVLPLRESVSALVWTLPDAEYERYMQMSESDFCAALETSFGERLGQIVRCGKRVVYPLALTQAKELCRPGFAVLGNAAHSLHPVAGQGFNLALRSVAAMLEGLAQAKVEGKVLGSYEVLRAVMDQHKKDQFKIVNFSDQLVALFSDSSSFPAWARQAGLVGLNNLSALRNEFAKHTMGRAEPLRVFRGSNA